MSVGVVGVTLTSNEAHEPVPSPTRPGYVLWTRLSDQRVLSLQPGGSQEYRDPGTDGGFEQGKIEGDTTRYDYTWGDPSHPNPDYRKPKRYIHIIDSRVFA
jgi:hypothetical protein